MNTKMYGTLRGPNYSSCGEFNLGPSVFVACFGKKKYFFDLCLQILVVKIYPAVFKIKYLKYL